MITKSLYCLGFFSAITFLAGYMWVNNNSTNGTTYGGTPYGGYGASSPSWFQRFKGVFGIVNPQGQGQGQVSHPNWPSGSGWNPQTGTVFHQGQGQVGQGQNLANQGHQLANQGQQLSNNFANQGQQLSNNLANQGQQTLNNLANQGQQSLNSLANQGQQALSNVIPTRASPNSPLNGNNPLHGNGFFNGNNPLSGFGFGGQGTGGGGNVVKNFNLNNFATGNPFFLVGYSAFTNNGGNGIPGACTQSANQPQCQILTAYGSGGTSSGTNPPHPQPKSFFAVINNTDAAGNVACMGFSNGTPLQSQGRYIPGRYLLQTASTQGMGANPSAWSWNGLSLGSTIFTILGAGNAIVPTTVNSQRTHSWILASTGAQYNNNGMPPMGAPPQIWLWSSNPSTSPQNVQALIQSVQAQVPSLAMSFVPVNSGCWSNYGSWSGRPQGQSTWANWMNNNNNNGGGFGGGGNPGSNGWSTPGTNHQWGRCLGGACEDL